jgi:cytidine deaminase
MTNIDCSILRIKDDLIDKRKKQIQASGYQSTMNAYHMCALLDHNGNPLIYGTNIFNIKTPTTEHAEAQALRKLLEKYCNENPKKKIKVDLLVVRTNGGNSKPCDRCIRTMESVSGRIQIRNIYYSHHDEIFGLRCVRYNKFINEPDRHYSSYDRNLRRRTSQNILQNKTNISVSCC